MNTLRKILACVLVFVMVLTSVPFLGNLGVDLSFMEVAAAEAQTELAMFPMTVLNIVRTNTKIDADQKKYADPAGGHVHYAWDLSGKDTTLVAPFTGKVIFADKSGAHSVILESVNKVKLANGTEDYITCMFTHDDKLNSNIKVGDTIKQGDYFYDQGTFGDGKTGTFDRHVHIEAAVGRPSSSDKSSFGKLLNYLRSSKGRQLADVFHLAYGTTHQKDYVKVACLNDKIIKFDWKTLAAVDFNTNGGSAITRFLGVQGKTLDLTPYVPTKDGCEFDGWYSDSALTAKVTSLSLKGTVTVYAKWKNVVPPVENDPVGKFIDIDRSAWYFEGVEYALKASLMNGTSNDRFSPNDNMTRAMLVTVLWRFEGCPEVVSDTSFTDLSADWYIPAVKWANVNGIVKGTSDSTFSPDAMITREQLATILFRYSEYQMKLEDSRVDLGTFPDAENVSSWATDAVSWAVAKGLIQGTKVNDVTYLSPSMSATRAQVALVVARYYSWELIVG